MGRRARLDQTDSLHHVMARTVERRSLFNDDADRVAFLDFLSQGCPVTGTKILAWALMDTHIHLLVRCGEYPLSRFVQLLLSRYARYFNKRHERTGHLFEGRFRSILVNDESYLLSVVRYIHLNPLVAGTVRNLDELSGYPWTGHRSILTGNSINGHDVEGFLSSLRENRKQAVSAYLEMMSSDSPAWEYAGSGFILGNNGLSCVTMSELLSEKLSPNQRILGQRSATVELARQAKKDLSGKVRDRSDVHAIIETILEATISKFGVSLDVLTGSSRGGILTAARTYAVRRLTGEAGLSYSEIGRLLGMTRQAVFYLNDNITGK